MGRNKGAGDVRPGLLPGTCPCWHLPHAGWLSTQQCWFIPSSAGTPEIYLVFVSPSIHVACLCAAVTFGLVEDE